MINIKIGKSNKCNGEYSAYIYFNYDEDIVNIIKSQPVRYYNPNKKIWEVPLRTLHILEDDLKGSDYEYKIYDDNAVLNDFNNKTSNYIPKDYKFKITPFKHQIEGVEYGLNYNRFLLGDEQGLGKTMQAINIACIKKQEKHYKHCLIICGVNGLKWNWKSEVEKHSDENAYILGTRYKKDKEYIGSMQDRLEDLIQLEQLYNPNYYIPSEYIGCAFINSRYFLITNIETLRNEKIIEKLKELCDKEIINMIVLDERA